MNYLKLSGLTLAILFCCAGLSAQKTAPINEPDLHKPRLFDNLPKEIPISTDELKGLLNERTLVGKDVSVNFLDARRSAFSGKIVSATSKYENKLRSVVIRSSNYNGATLTLSSSTNPDGTVTFKGRIISFQHADLYELEKKSDEYILVKKNYNELINE